MMRRTKVSLIAAPLLLAAAVALAQTRPTVPFGAGPAGIEGLAYIPLPRVSGELQKVECADGSKPSLKIAFCKEGAERRLLALGTAVRSNPTGCKALDIRYRLKLTRGEPPRLALVLFEKGGGVWYRMGGRLPVTEGFNNARLSLSSPKQAEFGQNPNGEPRWDRMEKFWLGLVMDEPAEGSFELSQAFFTSEPFRPSLPLRVAISDAAAWSVGKDPAAQGKVTTEDIDGAPCMKFQFSFPGGRHMYVIPALSLPDAELEGYRALCFTYKAELPKGIAGLLVMLREDDGSQYYVDPPPPASPDWNTITVPLDQLKLGGWSKDENAQLDLDQIGAVCIGVHGTTSESRGSGAIMVKEIQFVP